MKPVKSVSKMPPLSPWVYKKKMCGPINSHSYTKVWMIIWNNNRIDREIGDTIKSTF